jgi:DNA mismatch repair protein MutS
VSQLTPLMKQYWDIKSLHQDKILLFRMGDFYEIFFDDAIKAAPLLGITLTSRNKKSQDETPMCGMPHHSVAGPINKLLSHGLKVAMCDQIEDPKLAKGIVKRAVTRVLTPGMVYDPETLEQNRSHYIASLDESSVSFIDVTTGESFFLVSLPNEKRHENLMAFLEVLPVAELVLSPELKEKMQGQLSLLLSVHDAPENYNSDLLPASAPGSARRLLSYVQSISHVDSVRMLQPFQERKLKSRMTLSPTVVRHLEIFSNLKGEAKGSLFESIDRTKTPAGARRLREHIQFPLLDEKEINQRLDAVEWWRGEVPVLKTVREILAKIGDVERRLTKVSYVQAGSRDLLSLAQGLQSALDTLQLDPAKEIPEQELKILSELTGSIFATLVDEPPISTKQGDMIRKGVSALLDEYIELTTESHKLLQEMESREKTKTGISSLKIRYNNVFGYYIEITNTHKDKAPAHYQRKQTLSTAERFVTEELLELERKVITAQSKRFELEFEIFENLRKKIMDLATLILKVARRCSYIDVESSLAWLSLEQNYVRPQFNQQGQLKFESCRHPVVEQSLKGRFTPNSLLIPEKGCLLLTGPNMAGKSTLMRQVALMAIMAQMGSFVPAFSASLPIFDQIFTRIGASDSLTEGLSTFMVEMTETSEMLKRASSRSLLILDEVGRGTSTFDGMALAQGILEYILKQIQCLTLFATHYHELTALETEYPAIQNAHMAVADRDNKIEFLHTLTRGPALKSYGLHVAELAGVPAGVIQRASVLLKSLEVTAAGKKQLSLLDWQEASPPPSQEPKTNLFLQQLKSFSLAEKTPLDALNQIAEWQKSCLDLS